MNAPKTFEMVTEQDIWSESEQPRFQLGMLAQTPDGRKYRYCKNGAAALLKGKLLVSVLSEDNHSDIAVNTAEIGDTSVTVTLGATAVLANQYSEGLLVVNDDTGEGIAYGIKSHPASDGSEDIIVELTEPIAIAFVAGTTVSLVENRYRDLVIATGGTQTDAPAGVPNIDVTAAYYFWAQVRGTCAVLMSATNNPTKGEPCTIGEATDGSVSGRDAVAEPLVGISLDTSVSAEYNPVDLKLE